MAGDDGFYKSVLDNLYDGVYFVDRERRITYWNRGAERITGYPAERVMGRCCSENILMHVDDCGGQLCQAACPLWHSMQDGATREAQVFLHHASGHRVPVSVRVAPLHDAGGTVIGAVEVFSDNTSMVRVQQRVSDLVRAVEEDPLTGIGNRRYIETRLESALLERQVHGETTGVLFFDVDHFKRVNDTYGHDVGDAVLRMVAKTLARNVRGSDTVGRWGGEEFVALLVGVSELGLQAAADKLRTLVATCSLDNEHGVIRVTVSVGATLARAEDTLETLIRRADRLLYQSKAAGRDCVSLAA